MFDGVEGLDYGHKYKYEFYRSVKAFEKLEMTAQSIQKLLREHLLTPAKPFQDITVI